MQFDRMPGEYTNFEGWERGLLTLNMSDGKDSLGLCLSLRTLYRYKVAPFRYVDSRDVKREKSFF